MNKTRKPEDVVVKVPENEMKLLKDQQFFGKDRDAWFSNAAHQAMINELDKLAYTDIKQVRTLES
jgi:hypothetical protein